MSLLTSLLAPGSSTSPLPPLKVGGYRGAAGASVAASRPSGFLNFSPVVVAGMTVDRLAVEVTTGAASSVMRLGIYSDDGDGFPGDLLAETADLDTSTTGVKAGTISLAISGGLYWLCANPRGGEPAVRGISGRLAYAPLLSSNFAFQMGWGSGFGPTSGSLPAAGSGVNSMNPADVMQFVALRRGT